MRDDVVVTGIGALSSLGTGPSALVDNLIAGASGVATITQFDTTGCRSHTAALIRDFDPARHIDPLKLRRMDEVGRLAVVACRLAWTDAGLDSSVAAASGVVMGTATAGLHSTVRHLKGLSTAGPANVPALGFSNTVGNAAATLGAIELGLRGPNLTVAQKQASGAAAVALAVGWIRANRGPAFVCGGADDIEEFSFRIFDEFGVLSGADGGPEASRPFSASRSGFVLGAGAHMLVVERASSAAARGAVPYGEILGVAAGACECRPTSWPDSSEGLSRTMRAALADAGLEPRDVSVVFAAANSTSTLDRVEAEALDRVFGPRGVPVTAVKGALGEYAAGGTASIVAALVALSRGVVPPTLGCDPVDPLCPVDVRPAARAASGRIALVNAVADGGAVCSLVLRAASQPRS